jgi:FAD/FMN-containing dehydrogenase/Fe-S oxidoreductase
MSAVELPMPVVRPASRDNPEWVELAAALREAVRGEVRFDVGTRAAYSTDASNYRQVPIGVVCPHDDADIVAAVAVCRRFHAPVFSRGGGTSLGGQCTNTAVMLDMAKYYNAVESVDPQARTAIVQPGCVLDELNNAAGEHGLVFGPKPATHDHCTIGGMLGNNSCGSTAQWSGTTAANVRRLEVLTYEGLRMWVGPTDDDEYARIVAAGDRRADLYRRLRAFTDAHAERIRKGYPQIPRRISGYNFPDLLPENGFNLARALVGSESTLVTILRAEVELLPQPANLALLLTGYDDIAVAGDHVMTANEHHPHILEGLDHKLLQYELDRRMNPQIIHELPEVGAWLMIKMAGDTMDEAVAKARELEAALQKSGQVRHSQILTDGAHQKELDGVREAALGATSRVPGMPDCWPGWEDSAVPPERVGGYLRQLRALLDEFGLGAASLYGHLGHGCVHNSVPFDLSTQPGIEAFREFVTRAAQLVHSYGGSLSGEHGDGQARGELLSIMFGDELVAAFEEFKDLFDPAGKMNPGKVVRPNRLDSHLRLGTGYRPDVGPTEFSYPRDGGFAGVPTRCFGVGKCRRHDTSEGGAMCPSYQVTREEEHSTRGRMRLLFEMTRGETITDGWHSEEVNDALDLCLACKGCKSDCPVSVDMATYKAEFLSHHYEGRLRPRAHYSLGWLPMAARLAAPLPWAANALTHAPGLGRLAKRLAGVDPQREVPRFAPRRFTDAYRRRGPRGSGERGRVVLWPDTFTNSFNPVIAASAVVALEAAGYHVVVPEGTVCCGLTWISTGQLGMARRVLLRSLRTLGPLLREGLPVVGLEPSCTSVLRDDAAHLFGADPVDPSSAIGQPGGGPVSTQELQEDLKRLREQTKTFAELLNGTPDFSPRLRGESVRALVQTHCHQHAILGDAADQELMGRIGLDAEVLDSGCCGLAGDFGMTPEHRDVSLACAERVLLPRVRERDPGTVVLADGFSCRTQINDQEPGARPLHLAQLVARAVAESR